MHSRDHTCAPLLLNQSSLEDQVIYRFSFSWINNATFGLFFTSDIGIVYEKLYRRSKTFLSSEM